MTNKEMEAMLRRAGESLPGPAKAAPRMPPVRAPRRRLARTAALIAAVLLLTVTVCAATLEVPIPDAASYSQWTGSPRDPADYGLTLERTYGEYELTDDCEMWIIPKGATYLEALNDATYRALSRSYRNYDGEQPVGWGKIGIGAGSTGHPYWRAYYSMDENDVPTDLHDMTTLTYRDYTLFCGEYRSEYSTWLYVRWVDYDEGFIYSLSFHGAMADRDAALEFTKQLIDANR